VALAANSGAVALAKLRTPGLGGGEERHHGKPLLAAEQVELDKQLQLHQAARLEGSNHNREGADEKRACCQRTVRLAPTLWVPMILWTIAPGTPESGDRPRKIETTVLNVWP